MTVLVSNMLAVMWLLAVVIDMSVGNSIVEWFAEHFVAVVVVAMVSWLCFGSMVRPFWRMSQPLMGWRIPFPPNRYPWACTCHCRCHRPMHYLDPIGIRRLVVDRSMLCLDCVHPTMLDIRIEREDWLEWNASEHQQHDLRMKEFDFWKKPRETPKLKKFLTFKSLFSPTSAHTIVTWCWFTVVQTDGADVLVECQWPLQVQQRNVTSVFVGLVFWMDGDRFNANRLEWFRFFVASQFPFSTLYQYIECLNTAKKKKLIERLFDWLSATHTYPSTQWAAVRTVSTSTIAPPHNNVFVDSFKIIACHGNSPNAASNGPLPLGTEFWNKTKF